MIQLVIIGTAGFMLHSQVPPQAGMQKTNKQASKHAYRRPSLNLLQSNHLFLPFSCRLPRVAFSRVAFSRVALCMFAFLVLPSVCLPSSCCLLYICLLRVCPLCRFVLCACLSSASLPGCMSAWGKQRGRRQTQVIRQQKIKAGFP